MACRRTLGTAASAGGAATARCTVRVDVDFYKIIGCKQISARFRCTSRSHMNLEKVGFVGALLY